MTSIAETDRPQGAQQAKAVQQPKVEVIKLKRDLGVFGSFSIGFADVGADIYVALGLVLFFAMGAAPLALAVAALGYIFTALSYAELASAIPMAGGASIFAREAFDDFWAFVAGWGLLLDYTIDIALFGWITMGYLGSFLSNLGSVGIPFVGTFSGLNSINTLGIATAPNYTFPGRGHHRFVFSAHGVELHRHQGVRQPEHRPLRREHHQRDSAVTDRLHTCLEPSDVHP